MPAPFIASRPSVGRSPVRAAPIRGLVLAALLPVCVAAGGCASGGDRPPASRSDASAGNWSTWVLSSPSEVRVPPARRPDSAGGEGGGVAPPRGAGASAESARRAETALPAEPWMETAFELVSQRAKDPAAASRAYGSWRSRCTTPSWLPRMAGGPSPGAAISRARRPSASGSSRPLRACRHRRRRVPPTRLPLPRATPRALRADGRDGRRLSGRLGSERPRRRAGRVEAGTGGRRTGHRQGEKGRHKAPLGRRPSSGPWPLAPPAGLGRPARVTSGGDLANLGAAVRQRAPAATATRLRLPALSGGGRRGPSHQPAAHSRPAADRQVLGGG